MKTMLFQAASQLDTFQRGDRQQVSGAILKSAQRVIALQPIVDAIRERRNKWLAHLDPETVRDPAALAAKAKLTIPDLELAFKETEDMLIELSCLYEGTIGDLRFLGATTTKWHLTGYFGRNALSSKTMKPSMDPGLDCVRRTVLKNYSRGVLQILWLPLRRFLTQI